MTTFSPFDYSEIQELFSRLTNELFNESGRGAVLIATAHVEEHLTKLIEAVLPTDISKKNKDRLFNYPGPLSSFAAKINLAYAFRIIDENLYNSLNALRSIRNEAAHSPSSFSLHELNDRMKHVYDLGPAVAFDVKARATYAMMNLKRMTIDSILDDFDLTDEEREAHIKRAFSEPKNVERLEEQVPFHELLLGLCLICGLMAYQREAVARLTTLSRTWGGLSELVSTPSSE